MPAADELFRTTAGGAALMQSPRPEESGDRERGRIRAAQQGAPGQPGGAPSGSPSSPSVPQASVPEQATGSPSSGSGAAQVQVQQPVQAERPTRQRAQPGAGARRPSGRERHDEKITVYISPDELLGLEHARITLRGEYGVAVDRGRIVREAVAALLADLDARGPDSILVKRLSNGN